MSYGTETFDLRESRQSVSRLRLLDHHLSRMTRTYTNWVVIALYGKGKWNQVLLFREYGKVLAGLDSLFLGHFGSNDC